MKIRLSKKHIPWICLGLITLIFLGFLTRQLVASQSSFNQPLPDPFIQDIQALEQEQKEDLNPEERKSLDDKLNMLYAQSTQRAIGIQQLTDLPAEFETKPVPTLILSEKRMTGIIENPSIPFSTMDYLIENAWQDLIDQKYVLIFAGTPTSNQEQGVLLIFTESPHGFQIVSVPEKTGSIRVVDVKGFQLVLQSGAGDTYYFDVQGRMFITKLGEIVPTITPMPESIPTSTQPSENGTAYP